MSYVLPCIPGKQGHNWRLYARGQRTRYEPPTNPPEWGEPIKIINEGNYFKYYCTRCRQRVEDFEEVEHGQAEEAREQRGEAEGVSEAPERAPDRADESDSRYGGDFE